MKTALLAAAALAAVAASPARAQDKAAVPPVTAGPDGFSLQDEAGDFRVQIRGYAHYDGRFFTGDEGQLATDTFLLRRARPIVQGTLGRHVEFNLMPDFGQGTAVIQDAWVDFKPSAKVRVRAGKFKAPVGLERLQSATAIHFAERAFPTSILPNRDVGLMVHGDLAGGIVSYQAAVMNGAGDGASLDLDANDGKDLDGRIFVSPFRRGQSVLKDLGFGLSGTTGQQTGSLATYRTGGQVAIISPITGITADGTRRRYSPQLSFYAGSFGLLGEYAWSQAEVRRASDGQHFDYTSRAWQGTFVYVVGGTVSFAGARPARPFDPAKKQWGALELAARIHGLEIGSDTIRTGLIDTARTPERIVAWTAAANWVLTRNLKQGINYEHATFEGGAAGGGDRAAENVIFIRTQVSF